MVKPRLLAQQAVDSVLLVAMLMEQVYVMNAMQESTLQQALRHA